MSGAKGRMVAFTDGDWEALRRRMDGGPWAVDWLVRECEALANQTRPTGSRAISLAETRRDLAAVSSLSDRLIIRIASLSPGARWLLRKEGGLHAHPKGLWGSPTVEAIAKFMEGVDEYLSRTGDIAPCLRPRPVPEDEPFGALRQLRDAARKADAESEFRRLGIPLRGRHRQRNEWREGCIRRIYAVVRDSSKRAPSVHGAKFRSILEIVAPRIGVTSAGAVPSDSALRKMVERAFRGHPVRKMRFPQRDPG